MTSPSIGYSTLAVVPAASGFGKALHRDLDKSVLTSMHREIPDLSRTLARTVAPLAIAAGMAAILVGAGRFVSTSVAQAGGLQQSMGAIESVFKGSATQMHQWAIGAATSTGLARNEYNELATLIGSQLKNAGVAMDELGPKTNDLITLGADMASMFGGTSREAVEALSSALKGERDPIEKYGVSLTQAAINAKAAELGFEAVGGALSREANAAATMALIMEQTSDAHGNFAKESTTYEGVMQRLAAAWQNVSTTIGGAFLPFATAAGSILLSMMPAVQGVADGFASFGENMQYAFETAGGGLPGVAAMFMTIFSDIAAWFTEGGLWTMTNAVVWLFNHLDEAVGWYISVYVPAVLDLYKSAGEWWVADYAPAATSVVVAIIPILVGLIPPLVSALGETVVVALPVLVESAVALFLGLVESLIVVLPTLLDTIVAALGEVAVTLLGSLPALHAASIELFMTLVEAILDVLPDILNTLLTDVLPNVLTTVLGMLPDLLTAGVELFFALVTAILDVLPDILKTLLVDVLPNVLTTVLGMLPDLLTAAIELFFALVEGVLTILPDLIMTLLTEVLPSLLTTLIKMLPRLIGGAIELFGALVAGLIKNLPGLINTIIFEVIPAIIGALIEAVPQLLQAGVDLLMGLIDGLWSMAGSVADALVDIISGAVDGFLEFLGIHSPSRLFRGFGANVGEGLADDLAGTSIGWAHTEVGDEIGGGFAGELAATTELAGHATQKTMTKTRHGSEGLTAVQEIQRAWRELDYARAA